VKKASLLYDTIAGSNGFYFSPVEESVRSKMNVPFTIPRCDAAAVLTAHEQATSSAVNMTAFCVCTAVVTTRRSSVIVKLGLVLHQPHCLAPLDVCCCLGGAGVVLLQRYAEPVAQLGRSLLVFAFL
jgi:hypothetical protein